MIIKSTRQVSCIACRTEITLREYEGLEDTFYSNHTCREALARELESLTLLEKDTILALMAR